MRDDRYDERDEERYDGPDPRADEEEARYEAARYDETPWSDKDA